MLLKQVFVKMADTGRLMTLEVKPSDTIREVKKKIQEKEGIPTDDQQLTCGGRPLEDYLPVSSYRIQGESTLVLLQRLSTCVII